MTARSPISGVPLGCDGFSHALFAALGSREMAGSILWMPLYWDLLMCFTWSDGGDGFWGGRPTHRT